MKHTTHESDGSILSYTIGFGVSVILTLAAFWAASHLHTSIAIPVIVVLAVAQLFVQLTFFLHLGREHGPRWNLGLFMFTVGIIGILVGGTLWIMNNLAHLHMQPPTETDLYTNGVVAPQNELK